MAKKDKNNIQEVAEDEVIVDVIESTDYKQSFIEKYQNYLIYAAGGILLVVAAFFAYKYLYLAPKEKEAITEMRQAELQFERDSFALALDKPGEGFMGFNEIIDEYSGTKAGNLAKYYAGLCYLNTGKFQEAIDLLNDFDEDELLTSIPKYGALGDAYSELKDFENAKKYYKIAVEKKANDLLTPYYLHKLAILYRSESKNDEAAKYFKRLKEEFPSSSYGRDVEKMIFPPSNE
ncbi:MAG: tetratricopeptide repeat protein [Deltaproteobacteria bacterium]